MFSEQTNSVLSECIEWRRTLHKYPELAFREVNTTRFIAEILEKIPGLTLSYPTKTGLIADLIGAYPGPKIAIRTDIDALPITEENDLVFCSVVPGVMHACGHDGHTAILLAAAKILAADVKNIHGSIRFIFQHAEELPPGGAAEMAAAGVLSDVDEVYGYHLSSNFATGMFGFRAGALTSATDRFDITIHGKGGHSAFPESTVDPVVIAARIITDLQTIVSRNVAAVEPAVLSVCMVNGGTAYNIIPGEMTITGSTRTFSRATRKKMEERIEAVVKGACEAAGASYDYSFSYGYGSVMNDPSLTKSARSVTEALFGPDHTFDISPLMPGEDFSAFSDLCPGFFVELGAGSAPGCNEPHHNAHYRMDEDALAYGIEYLTALAKSRLS